MTNAQRQSADALAAIAVRLGLPSHGPDVSEDSLAAMREVREFADDDLIDLLRRAYASPSDQLPRAVAVREALRATIDLRLSQRSGDQADAIRSAVDTLRLALVDVASLQGALNRLSSGRTAAKVAAIAFAASLVSAIVGALLAVALKGG